MAGSTPLEAVAAGRSLARRAWTESGTNWSAPRQDKSAGTREMIGLVRVGSVEGWGRLIVAVEETWHLGDTDAAAVLHIFRMPDPEQRYVYGTIPYIALFKPRA